MPNFAIPGKPKYLGEPHTETSLSKYIYTPSSPVTGNGHKNNAILDKEWTKLPPRSNVMGAALLPEGQFAKPWPVAEKVVVEAPVVQVVGDSPSSQSAPAATAAPAATPAPATGTAAPAAVATPNLHQVSEVTHNSTLIQNNTLSQNVTQAKTGLND